MAFVDISKQQSA